MQSNYLRFNIARQDSILLWATYEEALDSLSNGVSPIVAHAFLIVQIDFQLTLRQLLIIYFFQLNKPIFLRGTIVLLLLNFQRAIFLSHLLNIFLL